MNGNPNPDPVVFPSIELNSSEENKTYQIYKETRARNVTNGWKRKVWEYMDRGRNRNEGEGIIQLPEPSSVAFKYKINQQEDDW